MGALKYLSVGSGYKWDTNALSFLATNSYSALESSSLNNLVKDIKSISGLVNFSTPSSAKLQDILPFLGNTASKQQTNLLDPRNLDAAFRLSFIADSLLAHEEGGYKPDGSTQYAETFWNNSNLGLNDFGFTVMYPEYDNTGSYGIGAGNSGGGLPYSNGELYAGINNASAVVDCLPLQSYFGIFTITRDNSANFNVYKNGALLFNKTQVSTANSLATFLLGGIRGGVGGSPYSRSNRLISFCAFHKNLTASDVKSFHKAIHKYRISLKTNCLPFSTTFNFTTYPSFLKKTNLVSTFILDGTKLIMSGSPADYQNLIKYIQHNEHTHDWTQTINFKVTTLGLGVAVGLYSILSNNSVSINAYVNCASSGADKGKIIVNGSNMFSNVSKSTSSLTINTNDIISFSFTIAKQTMSFIATNITTSTQITHTVDFPYSNTTISYFRPNLGNPTIFHYGGTIEVNSWQMVSNLSNNIKTVVLGDSISMGYLASTYNNAWTQKVGFRSYAVFGGGGEEVINTLDGLRSVLIANPTNVLINIGTNNMLIGGAHLTNYQVVLDEVVATLQAFGINVYLSTICPYNSNTSGVTTINTAISAVASKYSCTVIDFHTALKNYGDENWVTSYVGSDGIHPIDAGMQVMSNLIINSFSQLI